MSNGPRSRQIALLALSAGMLVVGAAVSRRQASSSSAAPTTGPMAAATPSPLPSGAPRVPTRALDDGGGCSFSDRGFGVYERWRSIGSIGRALIPRDVDPAGFDVLVHFHGAEPVRKMLAPELDRLVIVGVDAGTLSSDYESAVADRDALERILGGVKREVAAMTRASEVSVRGLALSSWSAGYGAVGPLLARSGERVRAVVLIDSLHASFAHAGEIAPESLAPFVEAATRGVAGEALFFLTHSEVQTDGYASTTVVARWLSERVGGSDRGLFFVRSGPGRDKNAHCDQLRFMPEAIQRHVLPVLSMDRR